LFFLIINSGTLLAQTMWQVNNSTSTKWMLEGHTEFDKFPNQSSNSFNPNPNCDSLKNYFYEIRFKTNWDDQLGGSISLKFNNSKESIDLISCQNNKLKEFKINMINEQITSNYVKFKDKFGTDYNIISAKIENNKLTYYFNGIKLYEYNVLSKCSPDLTYVLNTRGCRNIEKTKAPFVFDYFRVWIKADSADDHTESYKNFDQSKSNIQNGKIYSINPIVKRKLFGNKSDSLKYGTLSLLPTFYNKYSLSIQGKKLGRIQVDVLNNQNLKVTGFSLENVEYYVLDLSFLPTGSYKIVITVLNQTLMHEIPVINPDKIGEE